MSARSALYTDLIGAATDASKFAFHRFPVGCPLTSCHGDGHKGGSSLGDHTLLQAISLDPEDAPGSSQVALTIGSLLEMADSEESSANKNWKKKKREAEAQSFD